MQNKKLSFLSLLLAISFTLPTQAEDAVWKNYFSWIISGAIWRNFKDTARGYIIDNKPLNEWTAEITTYAMKSAVAQMFMGGILWTGAYAWGKGAKLWHYWKVRQNLKKPDSISPEAQPKVKFTDEQVMENLPEKLDSFQRQVLDKARGNWIEHIFLIGFHGNGKSYFLEWLANKAIAKEKKNAAYVKFFPMADLKALFDKNEGKMEVILDQLVEEHLALRPDKNLPFCMLVDDTVDDPSAETTKFQKQFYETMKNVMTKFRGRASFAAAGNFDLSPAIQSRFNEIAIIPNPSLEAGIKAYNDFFLIMAPNDTYRTSFLDEDYLRDNFKNITYLSLYDYLDKKGLEKYWIGAPRLKEFFGQDKSVLSLRDWSEIAASVFKRANQTEITPELFNMAMNDHIEKTRLMLKDSIDKSSMIPANIDGILEKMKRKKHREMDRSIVRKKYTKLPMRRKNLTYAPAITGMSSNKSKSYPETKLVLGAPGYDLSGMYPSTANLPSQPPASFPIDINNNNALVSLASTMEGSPLSSLSTVEGDK